MTRRNPNNPREMGKLQDTDAAPAGKSRKSAASAKPVTKAGASVRVQSKPVTKQEKRKAQAAKEKADRQEAEKRMSVMGNPDDPAYKKWRRLWWVILIAAVVATALSWILQSQYSAGDTSQTIAYVSTAMLIIAYALIIVAIFIDAVKIRPFRKSMQSKASKPMSKKERREFEQREAELQAAEVARKAARREKTPAFLRNIFYRDSKNEAKADEVAAEIEKQTEQGVFTEDKRKPQQGAFTEDRRQAQQSASEQSEDATKTE